MKIVNDMKKRGELGYEKWLESYGHFDIPGICVSYSMISSGKHIRRLHCRTGTFIKDLRNPNNRVLCLLPTWFIDLGSSCQICHPTCEQRKRWRVDSMDFWSYIGDESADVDKVGWRLQSSPDSWRMRLRATDVMRRYGWMSGWCWYSFSWKYLDVRGIVNITDKWLYLWLLMLYVINNRFSEINTPKFIW